MKHTEIEVYMYDCYIRCVKYFNLKKVDKILSCANKYN